MKMAKPSEKDVKAAEELCQTLNFLDELQRWQFRAALDDVPEFSQLMDEDTFNPENVQHLKSLFNQLVNLMWNAPSFHNRVISGMCHVIMYDQNQILYLESDCIDMHPRFQEAFDDLEREQKAARYWNMRYHQAIENPWKPIATLPRDDPDRLVMVFADYLDEPKDIEWMHVKDLDGLEQYTHWAPLMALPNEIGQWCECDYCQSLKRLWK
jgi:hypothetical protein